MDLPFPLLDAHFALRGTPLPPDTHAALASYALFVQDELEPVAFEVDRRARPHLAHHDTLGGDPEEVLLNPAHRAALEKVYACGLSTGAVEGRHPWWQSFLLGYLTTDVGCFCSATVTMATAFSLAKYGTEDLKTRFLPALLEKGGARQGATWATEAQGGSDLGANRARARPTQEGRYAITGEKYFCSNVGASCAVVTGRPEGAPEGPGGIRLFFVPSRRENGAANWRVRRLKDKLGTVAVPTGEISLEDSEAYLLGSAEDRLYPTMEMLNVSRVCNAVGSAGLMARGLRFALEHARSREAFGRRLKDHPLMAIDLALMAMEAETASLLAFDPAFSFDAVWKERPPRSAAALLFRFATHAAKLTTAEQAVRAATATMEVLGGPGYLEEFPVAKFVRDTLVLPVWEGGANRQALDAWEVSTRSHPEREWLLDAAKVRDSTGSDSVREFLHRRIQATQEPRGGEVSAKARLRALAELRQMALLERLTGLKGENSPVATRARTFAELFALARDGGPVAEVPMVLVANLVATL